MNSNDSVFIYSDEFLNYSFHKDHPFNQNRLVLTKDLLIHHNALTSKQIIEPKMISEDILSTIHETNYIQAVKQASSNEAVNVVKYGIGTNDTPKFPNMFEASLQTVSGSIEACKQVLEGKATHALNLAGGLHHGFPNKASGFCIFNDIAISIQYIRDHYNLRVLYIDTDAHHGDGVQHCFYDDPKVCTISLHETGRYLYPGTGKTSERGIKDGFGYAFNFPLDAFTEDESFMEVFQNSIEKITDYFQPDIIVSQHGVDAHYLDPLTHLHSTVDIFEEIPQIIHRLAHRHCSGKWIALGGGGYDIWRVVPRAWSQLWQVMNGKEVFTGKLSEKWLEKWQPLAPVQLPYFWQDQEKNYKAIPRRQEITETNRRMYKQVLKFIEIN